MAAELRLRRDVEWREIEGQIVAMDARTADCVAMNQTGTRLWRELVQGTTVDRLAAALVDTYRLDGETARRDVDSFLASLRSRQLLDT